MIFRKYDTRRIKAMFMLGIIVGALVLSVCNILFVYKVYAADTGTVTGDRVNIRSTPSTTDGSNVLTQLNTGDKVNVIEQDVADKDSSSSRKWCKISFTKDDKQYEGYIASDYVMIDITYTPEMDFEEWLDKQGFPESYKDSLRKIHAQYPKWVFFADHLDYSFDDVVKNEASFGRSLVSINAVSSWKSTKDEAYNWPGNYWYTFDGTKWNLASEEIVAFAVDPRNYLDTTRIFAFELLSFNANVQNEAGINSIISNSFMKDTGTVGDKTLIYDDDNKNYTYAQALMFAGMTSKVSPYHLATRIIQEVGRYNPSDSITGTMKGYEGYYNYYNIGAFATGSAGAIENGLIYAKNKGWNTRFKAIVGGAESKIGTDYIAKGQDTLYYERFDFIGSPYSHQYMTYIMAPYEESKTAGAAYSEELRKNTQLVFKIPVFKDMPDEPCVKPTKDGCPNNILKHMEVTGFAGEMTPAFNYTVNSYNLIVPYSTKKVNVYAAANVDSAKVDGNGDIELEVGLNRVNVVCTAQNGDKRTYTIDIYREEASPEDPDPKTFSTTLKMDEQTGYLSGIAFDTKVEQILGTCTYTGGLYGVVTDKNGIKKNEGDIICTGDLLKIYDKDENLFEEHPLIIFGDVDGNGKLDTYDFIYVRMHIRGTKLLNGCYLYAADADRKNDTVSTYDFIYIRMQIRGVRTINQY